MKGKRKMNCPNCGGALKIKDNKRICEYCGYEEIIPQNGNGDDFYNLMIINESSTPDDITVQLAESNLGFILRSGEAIAKDVPPGYHTMVVTSGQMTEYRSICVPGDGKAVKVYVAKGLYGLSIRVSEPGAPDRTTGPVVGTITGTRTGANMINQEMALSIMALVFSIIIPFIGLILALVDLGNTKKQGKKAHPTTIVALAIAGARFVLMFILLIIGIVAQGL